jgi:hypothetical protein
MIVYHGSSSSNFQVKSKPSRYGFPALFFTDSIELAQLYALHRAREEGAAKGYVYQYDLPKPSRTIDYQGGITHCGHFRNLMFRLYRATVKSALIQNCFDYPSRQLRAYQSSDVMVVFDLDLVSEGQLIQTIKI